MTKIFALMKKYKEIFLLSAIVIAAAFLRFYRLDMTFVAGFDQGNHLLEPAKLIKEGKLIFQGPAALEHGGYKAYLGPFYYYLLVIPLFLTNLNPISDCYLTGILSLASIIYSWYLAKKIFGSNLHAFFTSFLMAFTYFFASSGRVFTNPFYLPLFLLILIDAAWTISQEKKPKTIWWILFGFSLSAVLQIHASGFLLVPAVFVFMLIKKTFSKANFKQWLMAFSIFAILYLPYIAYQVTHRFIDVRSYYDILTKAQDQSSIENTDFISTLTRVKNSFDISFWDMFHIGGQGEHQAMTITWILALALMLGGNFWFKDKAKKSWYLFASLWIFCFLILSGLFKFPLWAYYFLAIYPVLFFVMADYLTLLLTKTKNLAWILLIPAGYLIIINGYKPIFKEINAGINRVSHNPVIAQDLLYTDMDAMAKYIYSDANNQPAQIVFCYKFFYPGCFSYQPTYDFLLKYKYKVDWRDYADRLYFVRNPRDIENCQPEENLKLIESKDFISVGVDKYERIKP